MAKIKYEIKYKLTPAFCGKQLSKAFAEYKKAGKGRTQKTLLDEFDDKPSRQALSSWLNGRSLPSDYHLEQLCRILNITIDDLMIKDSSDAYEGSTEYMTMISEKEIIPLCEKVGLDIEFLRALRRNVDFEKQFPLWRKIVLDKNFEHYLLAPERTLSDSAPMEDQVFQIRREVELEDGTTEERLITMCRADLSFLLYVQKELIKYAEFLFMKRADEMDEEADHAGR